MRKAVSVVLTFQDQIYGIRRQNHLRAFPGYFSFPGGKVDRTDGENGENSFEIEPVLYEAVTREIEEELGVNISELIETNVVTNIKQVALAITPDFNPVRFETYFFEVEMTKKVEFREDPGEIRESFWRKPSEFIESYESGDFLIVPPVLTFLKMMDNNESSPFHIQFEIPTNKVPMIENISGVKQFMPETNTLPPANRTNCFVLGDEEKVIVDPCAKDKDEMIKLIDSLKGEHANSVLFTHHHIDHFEFGNLLVKELDLPVYLSKTCHDYIKKQQSNFFDDLKVEFLSNGDKLGKWKGEDILIIDISGHAFGHLGLYPESKKWFIAGDLFQGIGSVVVGLDDGDMVEYMETLQKVIDLDPQSVFPSHGIGLGGTNIIKRNLLHRKMREEQVKKCLVKGYDLDQMISEIYPELNPTLVEYAKYNIRGHLKYLKVD